MVAPSPSRMSKIAELWLESNGQRYSLAQVAPEFVNKYLTQRFSIAGTPTECIERVRELERAGVTHLMITAPDRLFFEMTEAWSKHVFPQFSNRQA